MKKKIAALMTALTMISAAHAQEGVKSGDSEPANPAWHVEPDASYQAYVERVERVWVGECGKIQWLDYWLIENALQQARVCLRGLAPEIHPDVEATLTERQKIAARAAQDHVNKIVFEIGRNKKMVTHIMHHFGMAYHPAMVIPKQLKDAL